MQGPDLQALPVALGRLLAQTDAVRETTLNAAFKLGGFLAERSVSGIGAKYAGLIVVVKENVGSQGNGAVQTPQAILEIPLQERLVGGADLRRGADVVDALRPGQHGNRQDEDGRHGQPPEKLAPDNAGAYGDRGNAYRELGRYRRAIQDYEVAIRLAPRNALTYANLAIVYTLLGDDAEARQARQRAVELGADRAALESAIEAAKQGR